MRLPPMTLPAPSSTRGRRHACQAAHTLAPHSGSVTGGGSWPTMAGLPCAMPRVPDMYMEASHGLLGAWGTAA